MIYVTFVTNFIFSIDLIRMGAITFRNLFFTGEEYYEERNYTKK